VALTFTKGSSPVAKAATEYSTAWGTPDPRDLEAYPKVSGTPMPQWAWEFLRRRQDYRERWNELIHPFLDGSGNLDRSAVRRHNLDALTHAATGKPRCHWAPPWDALRDEFRVYSTNDANVSTLDPRLRQPPAFAGRSPTVVYVHASAVEWPQVLLSFDVTLPIGPQLEGARQVLLCHQAERQHPSRMQIDTFPRYLRLLDFKEARAPNREIGDYLFSDSVQGEPLRKLIRQNLKAAQRWQNNYLGIALHSPLPRKLPG
jgi:Proteobacterial transcriptional regulator-like domain